MTLTIYDQLEQGAPEWVEARCGLITASTVRGLLTAKWETAHNETSRTLIEKLALERITGRVQYMHPTFDMQRGTLLEEDARNVYNERYGTVYEVGFGRVDDDGYSYGASPDGLSVDGFGGLEIKCPKPGTHFRTLLEDKVPTAYLPQIHMNMLVFERDWWDFMSHDPGQPPYVRRVPRDDGWDAVITEAILQAEDNIFDLAGQYAINTHGNPPTTYHDPFAEEEEITF